MISEETINSAGDLLLRDKPLGRWVRDHLFAPLRLTILSDQQCGKLGLTSINQERIAFARRYVRGRLLDVGCGRNFLVKSYAGFGVGVDVFDWHQGALILKDTSRLPFRNQSFDTVAILAAFNHIPNREAVLNDVHRVLKDDGQLVVTMITPTLSTIGHRFLWWYSDDWIRGMAEGEVFGFTARQMVAMMAGGGFQLVRHERFLYRLNHLYIFTKS